MTRAILLPTWWAALAAVFVGSPSLHGATDPPIEPIDEIVPDQAVATTLLFERCAVVRGDPVRVQEAIDLGADVNARNEQGKTPLMVALGDPFGGRDQRGEARAVVDTLLAAGADVRAVDDEGWSVLHWAAAGSLPKMITKLLDAGADLDKRGPGGLTPLMVAARWNDFTGVVPIFLEAGADVGARAEDGSTLLMFAMFERAFRISKHSGDLDVVRSLLAAGAAVNESDVSGRTPLLLAAAEARDPALLGVLLDAGADPAVRDPEGRTPLMIAVLENRSLPFFERLLQVDGVEVDAVDAEGCSAIFLAATSWGVGSASEKIALLVEAGADVDLASDEGNTPLCGAASKSRDPDIVRQLIVAGADLEVASCDFGTPLMSAARYGNLETVEVLLSGGAEVETANEDGRNALMWAAISDRGPSAKVETLLAAGADIHAADKKGETPLMWGVGSRFSTKKYRSTLAVVSRLLAADADVDARNWVGATALMKAAYWCDDPRVLLRLMQAGADVQYQVRSGVTALDGARNFKNTPEVIAVLREAEASMAATGTVGYSPLMFAAAIDETPESLVELIESGAEVNERGFGGGTALIKAARFNRNPEVIAILIAAGADPELRDDQGLTALDWALRNKALRDSDAIGELEIANSL